MGLKKLYWALVSFYTVTMFSVSAVAWRLADKDPFVAPTDIPFASTNIYKPLENQLALFNSGIEKADAANKILLVIFGAEWCDWCQSLHRLIPSIMSEPELTSKFVYIEIATSSWNLNQELFDVPTGQEVLSQLIAKSRSPLKVTGVPFLAFIDPKSESNSLFLTTGKLEDNTNGKGHSATLVRKAIIQKFNEMR